MKKDLIKLKTFCEQEEKKAYQDIKECIDKGLMDTARFNYCRHQAFLEVINQLDLILNNSVVNMSERRSPTDESFSGCKPPDERQNPQEYKILECGCSLKLIDYGVETVVNKDCEPHMKFLKSVKDNIRWLSDRRGDSHTNIN